MRYPAGDTALEARKRLSWLTPAEMQAIRYYLVARAATAGKGR